MRPDVPSPAGRRESADPPGQVLLGEFGRAQGLRGEIRLKSHTADPLAISSYGALRSTDGRSFTLASVRRAAGDQPDMLVAHVEGVATREAAEALNRVRLYVPRDQLGPAEEDEFFLTDLIGLSVEHEGGRIAGRVVAVPNYGGGELLEIAPVDGGPTTLVPFTRAFVPVVDVAGGRVVLAPVIESEARDDGDTGDGSAPASTA